jgi:light-regulated signal transduction histidine kinase (bacteriophytochrome)
LNFSFLLDSGVLEKVFVGLLKNAIENTPDEGRIKVSARLTGSQIRVEIQDDGVGMTEEHQQNIFGGFLPAQHTEMYASKQPYDFNAGGAGLDLLRIKIFSERIDFRVGFESTRCKNMPRDTDLCPGKISACRHVKDRQSCLASGGSTFKVTFPHMS